ncbi:unannotated protein [freshwater metagenome]|uniref:Unannotated protein n=1 Tax=freshwater metagenome TaxID=449393 RepID=A0A6J6GVI5_9ZZZZ
MEALPIGIFLALATNRSKEALGCGVGANHHGNIGKARKDLCASRLHGLCARSTRGIRRRNLRARPTHCLGERGASNKAGVAVTNGVGTGHELNVAPGNIGIGKSSLGRDKSVVDEILSPLAPWMHACTENYKITFGCHHALPFGAEGAQVQIQWSTPSSSR